MKISNTFMRKLFMASMLLTGLIHGSDDEYQETDTQRTYFPLETRMLNEAKGQTIWLAPEKEESLVWPKYGDLSLRTEAQVVMPGEFEITTAPRTSYRDAQALHYMMGSYDASFVTPESMNQWTVLDWQDQDVFTMKGTSAIVRLASLIKLCAAHPQSLGQFEAALVHVMSYAEHLGAQQIFVETLHLSDKELNNLCVFLSMGLRELKFSKKNQPKLPYVNGHFIVNNRSLTNFEPAKDLPKIWYPLKPIIKNGIPAHTRSSIINDLEPAMNVILRDDKGNCVGGLCGVNRDQDALIELHLLVIKDALRLRGFGKKILEMLQRICDDHNRRIWVYPMSFHNTGFLEKAGYKNTVTFPKVVPSHDRQTLYDQYNYIHAPDLD